MVQPDVQLKDNILQEKVDELAKSIDEGVMLALLIESGWTKVPFHFASTAQAIEIYNWCEKTIAENQWHHTYGSFVFRNQKDAMLFVLRWS